MATLRRNTPDLFLLLGILALLLLGLVMVASSSTQAGLRVRPNPDPFYFIKRQLIYAAVGLVLMLLVMNLDYHFLRRFSIPLVILTPILLGLVLVIGEETLGARRWIDLGFTDVQVSEFAKIALVLILAHYLSELGDDARRFSTGIVIPLFFTGILAALIMAEPDMGTTLVICATCFVMIFAAGVHLFQLGMVGAAAAIAFFFYARSADYRWQRLMTYISGPEKDPLNTGYQIRQSLFALGSGGLFGVGIGRSRQKFSYLPEAHSDYIFSIIGEELGLVGTLFVVALFFFLIWRGLRTALTAPDEFGSLLAVGLTCLLGLQAVLNIGVVTAILPVTGITLPLVSCGGSSLVATMLGLGILLNVSKHAGSLPA